MQRAPSAASVESLRASLGLWKVALAEWPSRRPEFGGPVDSLQLIVPPGALRQRRRSLFAHGRGYENLIGSRRALRAGGDVDDRADRGQVLMRAAKLAEVDLAGVEADSDPDRRGLRAEGLRKLFAPRAPKLLDLARGRDCMRGMILMLDRKIEPRHDGVAHRLVDDAVVLPDRLAANVVKGVEKLGDRAARLGLREARIAPQIGEQDGRVDLDLRRLHDPLEHRLADRAGVGIHAALADADRAEWHCGDGAQSNGQLHILPAPQAENRL